jgi:hypothetical protein
MSKNNIALDKDIAAKLKEAKDNEQNLDAESKEALKSLEFANQIINAISSGKQIDMAFFKKIQDEMVKKLENDIDKKELLPKKVKKIKKLYK